MIEVDKIVALYHQRKARLQPVHAKMITIRNQYQNEVTVPLPELDKNETVGVANLIAEGVDQMAMRISSTIPSINYPPLRPGIERSEQLARTRRLATYSWWEANHFDRQQRKRSKALVAYAATATVIRPGPSDDKSRRHPCFKIPQWQVVDPLCTYPAPMSDEEISPTDAIMAYKRHLSWLTEWYPTAARGLEMGRDPSPDTMLEVLEYIDNDEHVMVAIGRPQEVNPNPYFGGQQKAPGLPYVELTRFPNRVGRCTVTYATRPSLECPISQFDGMPAVYKMQARAFALWMIASERAIFPDTWFVSRPNETVDILELPDGRAGIPGRVKGGDLKEVNAAPPPQTGQIIQMLDESMSRSASISSQLGGENPTGLRTGRAAEQNLSATIDYWIQEAQETLGLAYQEENKLAVAIAREYFGNDQMSFHVNWKGSKGQVDYTPLVDFETDSNTVSWPQAGSDVNQLVVGLGQRLGLDEISIRTAQELDPYIDDAEEEERRLVAQSVNKAFMASIDQAVAGGQVGPTELARFVEIVQTGRMDPYKAWQQLHDETQQQQAQSQQPPDSGGPAPGSPGAQPGLSAPGQQAALGLPGPGPAAGVSQPQPGVQHMAQLLGALKAPPQPSQAGAQ